MPFTCPYCDKSFELNDILYYADASESEKKFVMRVSGNTDAEQKPSYSAESTSSATDADIFNYDSIAANQEVNDSLEGDKAEESGDKEEFPLGVLIEDTRIQDFLKDYGEGKYFKFQRTARFYGIRSKDEIGDDQRYGYAENNNGIIPSQIYVPSRSKEHEIVTNPICPHCHCDLPWQYFSTPEQNRHIVALSGCSAAGKTQYITVALADLEKKIMHMNLCNSIELTTCSKWFHDMYIDEFSKTGSLAATNKSRIFPIVLQVTDKENKTHFITFYDCAGEYTNDREYALNRPGFKLADTLMVMVDAAQLFGTSLKEGERLSQGDYINALKPMGFSSDSDLLTRLKQVIVVLTKCDSIIGEGKIIHRFAPGSSIEMISYSSSLECHTNQIDLHSIQLNSNQLVALMSEHGIINVKKRIEDMLNKENINDDNITVFAVSTYSRIGGNSSFEKVKNIDGALFHRLTEPLLFAMYGWGIVKGKGEIVEPPPPGRWERFFHWLRR